jgi:Ca-activated chloride channel homolog
MASIAAFFLRCAAQVPDKATNLDEGFTLSLPVNEVSLNFHASDSQGAPMQNLSQEDVRLFDDGKPENRIVNFEAYHDLPLRAGILLDTSISMESSVRYNVDIATEYLARFFRRQTDRAFVTRFDVETHLERDWSGNPGILGDGLQAAAYETGRGSDGTAIFDSIYKACRSQWAADSGAITGNFILLFTDGMDNASHARIADVIDRCQRSRTAIYVFLNEWKARGSRGQVTLEELVEKSGGRIFYQPNDEQVEKDLDIMVSDMRSQYTMVYKAPELKRDGAFHRIKLVCAVRRCEVLTRSGYYAASRR